MAEFNTHLQYIPLVSVPRNFIPIKTIGAAHSSYHCLFFHLTLYRTVRKCLPYMPLLTSLILNISYDVYIGIVYCIKVTKQEGDYDTFALLILIFFFFYFFWFVLLLFSSFYDKYHTVCLPTRCMWRLCDIISSRNKQSSFTMCVTLLRQWLSGFFSLVTNVNTTRCLAFKEYKKIGDQL